MSICRAVMTYDGEQRRTVVAFESLCPSLADFGGKPPMRFIWTSRRDRQLTTNSISSADSGRRKKSAPRSSLPTQGWTKPGTRKSFTICRFILYSIYWEVFPFSTVYPRKTVSAVPMWTFQELCPLDLIKSLHLEQAAINPEELLRAQWFWDRRPKLLCENLISLLFCVLVFGSLLCLLPESAPALVIWMVAWMSCAFVDCLRLDQWRKEYESSIKRAILHLLRPKS